MKTAAGLLLVVLCVPAIARADGFTDLGDGLEGQTQAAPSAHTQVSLDGYLRARGELLDNLDLDRGLDPSGQPLFPVPLSGGQILTYADTRLRTDLSVVAPSQTVAVHARIDVLDNLALGSTPDAPSVRAATPGASLGQRPISALDVRRVYGEVMTPFGLVAAGRIGNDWGLGILANGGNCESCDGGDAADRVAFVTSLLGHLWALSYDVDATGPLTPRKSGLRLVDLDPTADVRTLTFAVMRYATPLTRARRRRAGRTTFEYGAWLSYRFQPNDVPASWLPVATPVPITPDQLVLRGYHATAIDGWLRLTGPAWRVEAESAVVLASVDQASLVPGVQLRGGVTSTQVGAALTSEVRLGGRFYVGLDAGYASGDPAPGFGAFPQPGAPAPKPGDLDGPQASPPNDRTADNFRMSPDFHIDRILFREIIGAVTDAIYLRPHVAWRLVDLGSARLEVALAAIASRAVYASSTPGGAVPLGIELDPTLRYQTNDGFSVSLEHAVLFPLAGLDNPAAGLRAQPAQLVRIRFFYRF